MKIKGLIQIYTGEGFRFLVICFNIILILTNTIVVLAGEERDKSIYLEPIVVTASRIEKKL